MERAPAPSLGAKVVAFFFIIALLGVFILLPFRFRKNKFRQGSGLIYASLCVCVCFVVFEAFREHWRIGRAILGKQLSSLYFLRSLIAANRNTRGDHGQNLPQIIVFGLKELLAN